MFLEEQEIFGNIWVQFYDLGIFGCNFMTWEYLGAILRLGNILGAILRLGNIWVQFEEQGILRWGSSITLSAQRDTLVHSLQRRGWGGWVGQALGEWGHAQNYKFCNM